MVEIQQVDDEPMRDVDAGWWMADCSPECK